MNETARLDAPAREVCLKWLRAGAIDPEGRFAWPTGNGTTGPWVTGSWPAMPAISGYRSSGLPYEVDQQLWVVELDEVVAAVPFSIPEGMGELDGLVEQGELRLLAGRGRLLRQVTSWTPGVADEFGAECAIEARGRVLQALRDAERLLEITQRNDLARVPIEQADRPERFVDPPPLRHAALALRNAEVLARVWRDARVEATGGDAHPASAFASAAALCRAAAARIYAESLDPSSSGRAHDVAIHAYLEERRRQARWLEKRLGLDQAIHQAARAA